MSSSFLNDDYSSNHNSWFLQLWLNANRNKPLNSADATRAHIDNSFTNLSRSLNLFELLLLGIGASIGAGVFVVTGTVAHDTGPGVCISFMLAGISSGLVALCFAELAQRFPSMVGGAYMYTYSAFNELIAFLVFGQVIFDGHVTAANIARSLSCYFISLFDLFPSLKGRIPPWIGDGQEFFGGTLSINILAPTFITVLTLILCMGVKESSVMTSLMSITKVFIVVLIVSVGSFEVDVSNWSPFLPKGLKAVMTGATVVYFSYIGFDAIANCAEEAKRPQRDLPIAIIGSLSVCIVLYVSVCLVVTGMIPYYLIKEKAPLAEAFTSIGLQYVSVVICIGAIFGLTTTILVGLYVHSRLYLGVGRDGLLPDFFTKVHPSRHTPINAQIFVGTIPFILSALFDVNSLSHFISVGHLTGYSVVSACVVALRWKQSNINYREGVTCLLLLAFSGFSTGLCYRYSTAVGPLAVGCIIAIIAATALQFRQSYESPKGFSCPFVPTLPATSIFINLFLSAQLHYEAWIRFVVLTFVLIGIYSFYGQHNARDSSYETVAYQQIPSNISS